MTYRRLGNSGLKVSIIGYGNWLNSNSESQYETTKSLIEKSLSLGINFFDTAEIYGMGEAEK
jgi:aryl-alcohol dehydrogenase-like predicted oxidoreductase